MAPTTPPVGKKNKKTKRSPGSQLIFDTYANELDDADELLEMERISEEAAADLKNDAKKRYKHSPAE